MIISLFFLFLDNYNLFMQLSFGLIITFLVAVIIRLLYFKERPNKEPYTNLFEKIDASAFPSIHSARISFLVLVFSSYFQNLLIITLLLIIGILVCYSRIYLRKHDFVDVVGGVIVGIVLGYLGVVFIR